MNTFLLALRNLLRNRRRSIATLLAMVFGLDAILMFGGYTGNVVDALQTGYVQRSGHLQIQHQDYFLYGTGNPVAYGIADYQRIIDRVKRDPELAPMLTVVTPILQLGGIAGNFAAGVSKTVIASGIVVDEQNQLRLWNDYSVARYSGPLALTGTRSDAAVIGTGVARMLQLCGPLKVPDCKQPMPMPAKEGRRAPDDIAALSALEQPQARAPGDDSHIEILAANDRGVPNVAGLTVVKAENQGMKQFDDIFMTMHLAQAQQLIYGGSDPQVTAIQVQLHHTGQIPVARARLQQLLAHDFKDRTLELQDYETLNPMYGQTIKFFKSVFSFIATLIGVIVLFTVGNTMSMAVVERTVEIGTLRAVGLRRGGIRRLFICEGLLLGLFGAVLGVLSAIALAGLINHSGISWTPPGYTQPYPLTVRVWGDWTLICGSVMGLMLVAILSAWWPAKRASKQNIVEALRHV
ncbi:MAG: ABC transporter permease [Burkholderiales bacterium]|nr:ABC transporter permease [Burkholderiales bacterium]